MRNIVLCADDYGLTKPINAAIRDLIEKRRLNATSVMVVTPGFEKAEAELLVKSANKRAQIGLHVTLTAPFGDFRPLPDILRAALLRQLDRGALAQEISRQFTAFADAFGRLPDFADGHQHVQLFPQIRDAFLAAVATHAPNAWVRQCGRAPQAPHKLRDRKALILDILSVRFRRKAAAQGLKTNAAFAGSYDFGAAGNYADKFAGFLNGLPDRGLVMCHPGVSDAELERLDPLTTQRERELAFFRSEDFTQLLAGKAVALA